MPTFYLIVHRATDERPTAVKVVDEPTAVRKYLESVARNAVKFDLVITTRSDSGITFDNGKSVTVTEIS